MKKLKLILIAVVVVCTMCVLAAVASTATEQNPVTVENTNGIYVYDGAGKVTITVKVDGADVLNQQEWKDMLATYKSEIKTIEFKCAAGSKIAGNRDPMVSGTSTNAGAIVGLPELETIILSSNVAQLQQVYIQNNPKLKTFGPEGTEEGALNLGQLTSFNNNSTTIAAWYFKGNPSFTKLILPVSGFTTLGEEAFMGCTGITEIVIPKTCAISTVNASHATYKQPFEGLTQAVTIYNEMADATVANVLLPHLHAGSSIINRGPTYLNNNYGIYTYDVDDHKVTITVKVANTNVLDQQEWKDMLAAWKNEIKTIEFKLDAGTTLKGNRNPFSTGVTTNAGQIVGLPVLETIILDDAVSALVEVYIQENPMLKTFGPSGTEEGTLDLSQITSSNSSSILAAWNFRDNPSFAKLILPASGITNLGQEAFKNCTGIKEIVIPETCAINTVSGTNESSPKHPFYGLTEPVTIYNNADNTTTADALLAFLPKDSKIYVNNQVDGDKTNDNDLTWAFDAETGTLTINGTSTAVVYGDGGAPWADNKTSIKTVIINAPITTTLYTMFSGYTALESVTLPQELTAFGPMTFDNCKALRELKINGGSPDGVIDLRKFSFGWDNTTGGWQLLQNAVADGATIWLPKTLDGSAFYNKNKFGIEGRTYQFVVYPGSAGSEAATYEYIKANKLNQNLSYTYYTQEQDQAMYYEYMATTSHSNNEGKITYDFDIASGKVTVVVGAWAKTFTDSEWITMLNTWKYAIKTVEIKSENNINKIDGPGKDTPGKGIANDGSIANLPELTTVIIDAKFTNLTNFYIQSNPKLKTFGPSGTKEGTFDLRQFNVINYGSDETAAYNIAAWSFKGNPSFTKLILPEAANITNISQEAFMDCTGIVEIVIPEACAITAVDGTNESTYKQPFYGLTQPVTIDNNADNTITADLLLEYLPTGSVIKEKIDVSTFNTSITFEGWSVRTASYNGLRGIFSHNKSVTNEGWTLAEYGALLAATAKKNAGGIEVTYDIATNKSSFKDYVKHFEICVTGENGLERTDKLILNTSDDNKTDFAVSIINYKSYYMIDVYMAGYEIWVRDGEYVVLYTDYADSCGDETFVDTSIYEVSLGMYKSGFMNAEKDAENIVWDSLVAGGALELTKDTGYTTTDDYTDGEAINMKTGEPFGDKFVVANVPLVNQAREEVDGVDTLVFTDAGTTYTILNDCFNPGKYVLIYRDDPAAPGTEIPGADLENGYRGQIYSKWYTDWAVTPIVKVSASRPNPVYASSVYNNCATVIIDHGITGTGMQAFGHSGGVTFMYHETFKNIASATWLDATKVTTIHLAQPDNKDFEIEEGLADISSVESVDPAILFKNTKITAVHMPDSSKWVKDENGDLSVSKEFAQREVRNLPAFKTLWCGDGTRKDGEINLSNTEVVTIGSNAFANKYSDEDAATTVKLPTTATTIADDAFTATEITIDHGTAYSGTIATYCETKGYTYNAGTPVVEANTGWSMIVF